MAGAYYTTLALDLCKVVVWKRRVVQKLLENLEIQPKQNPPRNTGFMSQEPL